LFSNAFIFRVRGTERRSGVLFNKSLSREDYTALVVNEGNVNMENSGGITLTGEIDVVWGVGRLSQYYFVHDRSHVV
jgi:hypothetical protein